VTTADLGARVRGVAHVAFLLVAGFFFVWLFVYFWTGLGGPSLLASTLVPVTFVLYALDALRRDDLYPRLGPAANAAIALAYTAVCAAIAVYMHVEFIEIGTVRAGFWSTTDLVLGAVIALLVMEYARARYFVLFLINIAVVLYAVHGNLVPGMFRHAGLDWARIASAMSVEMATGVFSSLPQLALTLIGSFVLVLSTLRAFGCVESLLRGATRIAARSPAALPQAAVVGSLGVAAVSGSGAANAVTTGSATIPAMIAAGISRESAAAIESGASLGGQLMPPVMGISAFLMAEFLGRSYFDVVARGYAPALVYFATIAAGVFVLSRQQGIRPEGVALERMGWRDWTNLGAFLLVVAGLIVSMAAWHLPPMFAALHVFLLIAPILLAREVVSAVVSRGAGLRAVAGTLLRFLEAFTTMTADLTLLLATLSILAGALVITGVPTKVGFLLLEAANVNLPVMGLVAFLFGALLGMGLPPAPTYILTALVIAPPMVKAGMDPWAVHFFAFFLAVWGELTPPTSVVAAVTAKIANASFMGTLMEAVRICSSLFVLMVAMFTRPALVIDPGAAQLGAMGLVLVAGVGVTFGLLARFSDRRAWDLAARLGMWAAAMVVLLHPDLWAATLACGAVIALVVWWWVAGRRRPAAPSIPGPRRDPSRRARLG
jgi:TRAP transporter 4TM/12TM fusion protein